MAQATQSPPVAAPSRPLSGFPQLQGWIQISKTHTVGEIDDAVRALASMPYERIQAVNRDLLTVRMLLEQDEQAIDATPRTAGTGHTLAMKDLAALFDLPDDLFRGSDGRAMDAREIRRPDSAPRRAIAKILVRAAMLHTDLLTSPARKDLAKHLESDGAAMLSTIRVDDAQGRASADFGVYWNCARSAMDVAEPTPDLQAVVREWYVATSAYLLNQRDHSAAKPHLQHARDTIPGEARLALYLGAVNENLAAPPIQALFEGGNGARMIGTRLALLHQADYQFRSALLLDPSLNDVRLRLGRTLLLLGRPDEALPILAAAEAGLRRTESKYAAALFSGLAQNELGNRVEARAAFARASALFPDAQSARLALAQLAMMSSNHAEALASIQAIKYGPASDPFWTYDIDLAWNVAGPLALLRANVTERLR